MPMAKYSNPAQTQNVYQAKELLKHAGPKVCLDKFAKKLTLPQNESDTLSMDRLVPFGFDNTVATEGVVPEAVSVDYENVQAVIQEYEHLARVSSRKWKLSNQEAVKDSAKLQGEYILNVNELLTWTEISSGTNVYYDTAAHTARTQVDSPISIGRIRKMCRTLDANKATWITKMNMGGPNIGTSPSEPAYIAFGHTNMKSDIRNLAGFRHRSELANAKLPDEAFGQVEDVIFVLTQQMYPVIGGGAATDGSMINNGTANDVYPLVIVGEDAYGTVVLAGADAVQPNIMSDPVKGADPTGKFVDIACLWYRVDKILNENWICRGEFAVTLNP